MKKAIIAVIALASFNASASATADFIRNTKAGVFYSHNGPVSTHKIDYSREEFLPCAAYMIRKEKPQDSFYKHLSKDGKGSDYYDIERQLMVGLTNSITLDLEKTDDKEFLAECELVKAGILK